MLKPVILASILTLLVSIPANAGPERFHAGTVVEGFGKIATIQAANPLAPDSVFKVAFDITEAAEPGNVNRHIDSAARLINLHHEAGVHEGNTQVALVVHGPAAMDLVKDEEYGGANANAPLIAALRKAGVDIVLCGQTAAYRDIAVEDLLPGVRMSWSAMTAHARLQQQGYTLNPF